MVELVDTYALGAYAFSVQVQILSRAPLVLDTLGPFFVCAIMNLWLRIKNYHIKRFFENT